MGLWGDESLAGAIQDVKSVSESARKPQPPGHPSLRICKRSRDGEGGEDWDLGLQRGFYLGDTRLRPSGWH